MSVIGPRPQLVRDMVFMTPEQRRRHTAKPGLSGLAQVNGRNAISWEDKIEWDLKYIEKVSLVEDIKIIFKTVEKAFVKQEGITEEDEKLYACKMNDLERDSMGAFLPKLDFEMLMKFYRGYKGETYNDTFRYPINGCDGIIDALCNQLDKNRIHLNEEVVDINYSEKTIVTTKGQYEYEYLINTAPLSEFGRMIHDDNVNILNYNKVLVLNIGFDKPSIDKQVSWAYYPGDEIFYRVGFYNNIASTELLSIYVEIGYSANAEIDISEALSKTLIDLKRTGVINEHQVVAYEPYIINPGYAHITTQGKEYTNSLIKKMECNNVFMVGRYARWEYSAMDDSLEQAEALAKRI